MKKAHDGHKKFGKSHGGMGGEMKGKLIDSPMAKNMVPKGGGKMGGTKKGY